MSDHSSPKFAYRNRMGRIQTSFFGHPFVEISSLALDLVRFDHSVLIGVERGDPLLGPSQAKS